jgi:hypothetical protein
MQQLSATDIANNALQMIGQNPIQQIAISSVTGPVDPNAIACNIAWNEAFGEVARETPWNCLKAIASLGQPIIPNPASTTYGTNIPSSATTWAPATGYAVNAYVIYAGYLYQCLIANTSSSSFTVDLTRGYWFQTNTYSPSFFGVPAGNTVSGAPWNYAYTLPSDFIALVSLNGGSCWGGWGWGSGWGGFWGGGGGGWGGSGGSNSSQGSRHEIYGRYLYTNDALANIVYIQYQTDTTIYDSLFTKCLILNLASMISPKLLKDGGAAAERMRGLYREALPEARIKNAGENRLRRYNLAGSSRWVRSRRYSTNG